ncbi:MAG: hypothetical protein GY832_05140 [Chloroflexi bacterium]|nr:hypothetical protein [Chloroflexota bacterium]
MGYKADGTWEVEDDSVETRVTGLMSKSNPLMTKARTGAKQYANRRGLLNSSMAAGAGESAALDVAMPIAGQDASQIHAKNMASMNTRSQEKIANQNVAAHDRQYAISALADTEKTYLAGWTEVMKNNNLNATQRTDYYNHLKGFAERDKSLVEQMYGITLTW